MVNTGLLFVFGECGNDVSEAEFNGAVTTIYSEPQSIHFIPLNQIGMITSMRPLVLQYQALQMLSATKQQTLQLHRGLPSTI